jgi:hypothetical protein
MIHRINPPLVVSADASSQSTGTIQFSNSNGVSFGLLNGVITASAVGGGGGGAAITVSDPATSLVASRIALTESNGLSMAFLTTTGGRVTITGSYTVPSTAGLLSAFNVSAGTTSNNLSNVVFSDSNNVSFGLNGSTVTASASYSQSTAPGGVAAGGATATSGTVIFSNSNGLTFGLNGQTVTASYTVPTVTNSSMSFSDANTSGTLARLAVTNLNGVTLSFSTGAGGSHTLVGSHNAITTGRASSDAVGLNTAKTNVTWTVNSSGLSLDAGGYAGTGFTSTTTAGTAIVGTHNTAGLSLGVPTIITNALTSQSSWTVSDNATSLTLSRLAFTQSNGLTLSLSTGAGAATVIGSYTVPTVPAQFSGGLSNGGNTSGDTGVVTGRVVFVGGNNITVSGSTNAGSMTITVSGPNVGGAQTGISGIVVSDTTYTSGTVSFSNQANVTIGSSANGATQYIRLSVAAQSNQSAIKGLGVSNTGQTAGNTGLSTGIDWVLAGSQSITLSQSTAGGGPNTIWFQHPAWLTTADLSANSSKYVQNWKLTGNTAGTTSSAQGTDLWISGGNSITVSGNSNTIVLSVGAYITTARASTDAIGLNTAKTNVTWTVNSSGLSLDAGGYAGTGFTSTTTAGTAIVGTHNTAGLSLGVPAYLTTQTNVAFSAVGGSSNFQTLSFSNANGVSFTNTNGQVGASIAPRKVSHLPLFDNPWGQTNFSISNATFSLQHFNPRADLTATQANLLLALSGNSGSSGALTVSLGVYTMAGSTASLASSDSRQISWTSGSQTTASTRYGGVSGTMYRTVALGSWGLSAGDYLIGVWFRTTNDGTWRAFGQQGPTIVNGIDANETNAYLPGFSTSSFTTAMPASINVTDTNYVRTGGSALQHAAAVLLGTF